MFEGAFNNNFNLEPIADFGAKRTLNIRGSVLGYIQTGNAYDRRYYKPGKIIETPSQDVYEKKSSTIKTIGTIAAIVAAGGALIYGIKSKKISKIPELIKGIFNKTKSKKVPNKQAPKENLFKKAGKALSDLRTKIKTSAENLIKKIKPKPKK